MSNVSFGYGISVEDVWWVLTCVFVTRFRDVWLYVKRVDATNAKYLAVLDRPGFGDDDVRVYVVCVATAATFVWMDIWVCRFG